MTKFRSLFAGFKARTPGRISEQELLVQKLLALKSVWGTEKIKLKNLNYFA